MKCLKPAAPLGRSNRGMDAPVTNPGAASETAREESELVRRAAAGDEAAFRTLVEAHGAKAYSIALRILGSRVEAEEAAQDAFLRVWRALPRFRAEAAFSTWLHRIALRCALDRAAVVRRRGARERGLDAAAELTAAADLAAVPAENGAARERRRDLAELVRLLPEAQQAVIALFYEGERSIAETARSLGMNENTVKTHLARGRAALRGRWLRLHGGRPV
jgi:RNA polymerase sigma-70 factor, ECF subfamily